MSQVFQAFALCPNYIVENVGLFPFLRKVVVRFSPVADTHFTEVTQGAVLQLLNLSSINRNFSSTDYRLCRKF